MTIALHPRRLVQLTIAGWLCACAADPQAEDGGTEDGDIELPQVCIDPGSPLLDNANPAQVPGETAPEFTCGSGWATDAPQRDASWTIEVPSNVEGEFGFNPLRLDDHPSGGVVVAGNGTFARYDADGDELWSQPDEISPQAQVAMAVEAAGTIVLATFDWAVAAGSVLRYDADGNLLGPVAIAWNDDNAEVWALETYGDELIIGAFDRDAGNSFEATLLRLDAADNLLLRKSTTMTNSGQLAVNDNGNVAFGAFPTFVLALDNGAVLGTLTPSAGTLFDVAGFGSGFVMTGSTGDFSVARYSEAGVEQWIQTYDRAALGDSGRAIAVGPDGTIVAVGSTSLLDFSNIHWFGSQPWIVAVDGDGNAIWADRIAAVGDASGVVFGSEGEVYVAGHAEGLMENPNLPAPVIVWLRRYDP